MSLPTTYLFVPGTNYTEKSGRGYDITVTAGSVTCHSWTTGMTAPNGVDINC